MKELKGFEGLYWIYPNGDILTKTQYGVKGKEAILKPATDKKGYQRVGLMKDGKLITKKVHRLVAENYIDNPNNFNNHKEASVDYAKLNLTPIGNYKLELFYTPYLVFLMENVNQLNYAYYKKYFTL